MKNKMFLVFVFLLFISISVSAVNQELKNNNNILINNNFIGNEQVNNNILNLGDDTIINQDITARDNPYWTVTNGLIHYWNFNEPDNYIIKDVINGLDLRIRESQFYTRWTEGKINNSIRFYHSLSLVGYGGNIGKSILNNNYGEEDIWTVSFWIKLNRNKDNNILNLFSEEGYWSYINIGTRNIENNIRLVAKHIKDINREEIFGNTDIELETWNYVTVVYNHVDHKLKLYLNGVSDAEDVNMNNIKLDNIIIIAFGNNMDINTDINIDEIGMWNRELTPQEIRYLYNDGEGLNPINQQQRAPNPILLELLESYLRIESIEFPEDMQAGENIPIRITVSFNVPGNRIWTLNNLYAVINTNNPINNEPIRIRFPTVNNGRTYTITANLNYPSPDVYDARIYLEYEGMPWQRREYELEVLPNENEMPPVFYDFPSRIIFQENENYEIDMSNYVFDANNDEITYNIESENIEISQEGNILTFSAPEDWSGQENIIIVAEDWRFESREEIIVTVMAENSNEVIRDGISYYLETDKSTYRLSDENGNRENVRILFRITNLRKYTPIRFYFNDHYQHYFEARDEDENLLWYIPKRIRMGDWENLELILEPGEFKEFITEDDNELINKHWDLINEQGTFYNSNDNVPVEPGRYEIIGSMNPFGYFYSGEYLNDMVPVSVFVNVIPQRGRGGEPKKRVEVD